jgi:MFS transporter, DHA1 family, multidrug resistance protein
MDTSFARKAIVLGLLAAVGPFAIDMYLPALPTIAADLRASHGAAQMTQLTQMTLMVYFIAFGVCQIVYGPVSDAVGRKPPLFVGLSIFAFGSIGCSFAPSIEWLIAFRFLQGMGASSVMVIPRAIVRDLHTGTEATRLMSLMMLVFSVSPILAPLVGSALIVPFGWRAVFVAVAITSVFSMLLVRFFLEETRPPEKRVPLNVPNLLNGFARLLRHRNFMGLTFIAGFGMSSFFTFLANSSFVYIDHFGLTPTQFSMAFAVNAVSFIGASQFAATLGKRFGMTRVVMRAVTGFAFFAVVLFALTLAGVDRLWVIIALLFCTNACLGLVIPSIMVLALEEHGPIAGLASALGGMLQMLTGGAMMAISSFFFDGTALPMVTTIAVCAVVAFSLSLLILRDRRPRAAG